MLLLYYDSYIYGANWRKSAPYADRIINMMIVNNSNIAVAGE